MEGLNIPRMRERVLASNHQNKDNLEEGYLVSEEEVEVEKFDSIHIVNLDTCQGNLQEIN